MIIIPRRRSAAVASTFLFDGFANGALTLTMPTHYAPSGGVQSLLIGVQCNSYQSYTAPPDLPTGGGWTALGNSYSGRGGYNIDIRYMYKFAASASEVFGTVNSAHVNGIGCWSFRVGPVPVTPADLMETETAATTGFSTTMNWDGMTIGTNSRVLSTMVYPASSADGDHVERSGLTYTKGASGVFGFGYTDEISSYSSTTTTFGVISGSANLCLEIRNPASF